MTANQDQIGAAYREAMAAVATHRRVQAVAEQTLARLRRNRRATEDDLDTAEADVRRAHADVQWCLACMIAAAEAYKGMTLDEAIAAGLADRSNLPAHQET